MLCMLNYKHSRQSFLFVVYDLYGLHFTFQFNQVLRNNITFIFRALFNSHSSNFEFFGKVSAENDICHL